MKGFWLGILLGSLLTSGLGIAADYLHTGGGNHLSPKSETQVILGEIRTREALETIQMQRQNYLDQQVHEAGKVPCR